MSNNNSQIAKEFIERKPVNKKLWSKVRGSSGWAAATNHGLVPPDGAARFSYDEDGTLWSYQQMELAKWLPDNVLLVNADEGPSNMTKDQQRTLRAAFRYCADMRVALVPFSALNRAGVTPRSVVVVDTTPDTEIRKDVVCRSKNCKEAGTKHTHERLVHFLGEVLFCAQQNRWDESTKEWRTVTEYYVSGLDRNDDPERRNFFLARLPQTERRPKTVDEGLALLRPKTVPVTALRQGEWFLVPCPDERFKPEQIIKDMKKVGRQYSEDIKPGAVLVSDDPKEQYDRMQAGGWGLYNRRDRHRATRMVCADAVYVSGMLRDAEHGSLKIGDGKTWHKVVRNLSEGSWRAGGYVD